MPREPQAALEEALGLMLRFAERTGLTGDRPQQRYLWTDAFAVGNFLGLARATGPTEIEGLALRLVDRVHHTLGRHRPDDARRGWISGLPEAEGEVHPTWGGLRIGKRLPERRADEPFDEELEWDRDGQYFHYLTKWMRALDLVALAAREPRFNRWGRELAAAAARGFATAGGSRLAWKMSIDLSRPLVPSMGQHDALDGFLSCALLAATARELRAEGEGPSLARETAGLAAMAETGALATGDPLGIGSLLMDACLVGQLLRRGAPLEEGLLRALLAAALSGLRRVDRNGDHAEPAELRLGFRELGLAIGLRAVDLLCESGGKWSPETRALLDGARSQLPLADALEAFWLAPESQRARTWREHQDINEVMLATSLAPEGFLLLPPAQR